MTNPPIIAPELKDLPHVSAETEQEAKEKLLLASAQFGHITQEGFDTFTFDLDPDWIQETVHFDALPFVFGEFETKIKNHDSLEDTPDELPGAAALKPFMSFASDLPWDVPPLLPEMLIPIPQPIDTWAGPDVCTDDGEMNWVYNWGSDSVIDLPMDRTLLAFYLDDAKFENFWFQPDKYVAKMINRGIGMSIAPNYSLWSDAARATHLYNIYRSRWVARYFQEAGIYVVPDINWSDERSFEFCLLGIPISLPAVSVQLQTV